MSKINRVIVRGAIYGKIYNRLSPSKRNQVWLAFDEAEEADSADDVATNVVGCLKSRLSREELQAVIEALNEVLGTAMDEPPDGFVGPGSSNARAAAKNYEQVFSQEKPGRSKEERDMAQDSRRRASNQVSYDSHFPDAAKIALDGNYGRQPNPKAINAKSSTLDAYAEMFPGADQIKKI